MAVNKIDYYGETLIDLTDLDVTAKDIIKDKKGIDKAGNKITGTLEIKQYYTGSGAPSNLLGNDGDIYLQE